MPTDEINMPPHQHNAATTPAFRGPARSSQPPHSAAAQPRNTKYSVYIPPSVDTCQSHVVVNSSAKQPESLPHAAPAPAVCSAFDSGSQNTEKPYAMPMQRWMASAAGGTSQRVNPGPAMIRSLSSSPGWELPCAGVPPAPSTVDIRLSPRCDARQC